jgi:pimeloyl-ACP methyl ester carboxylesterase
MIPLLGETPAEWWESTRQDAARRANDLREGRPPDAPFDPRTYFFHDVPPALTEYALSVELPQSDTPFGSRLPPDRLQSMPTRVVVGRDDRFFPAEFQRRIALERLGITPDDIPGGHLVALSRPTELVDRLEAYVAELALPAKPPR